MTAEHLADILTVEAESFPHPWTEKMFLEELSGKFPFTAQRWKTAGP